jgi:hypothetical protein
MWKEWALSPFLKGLLVNNYETGNRKQETGVRKQESGVRKQESNQVVALDPVITYPNLA